MSVKNAPTAPQPPTLGYPAMMPTAKGRPMEAAHTSPISGEAMEVFIWSVHAHGR